MRIGLLTSDLTTRHGWGTYSLNLIDALRRADVAVDVVAARNNTHHDDTVLNVLPAIAPTESLLLPKLALTMPRVRAALQSCDIIHTTIEPYAPLAAWIGGRRSVFITGHGSYVRLSEIRRWPYNVIYRRAFARAHVVCVSHYTARVMQQTVPGVSTSVINNGIDATKFANISRRGSPSKIIITVGGVKSRKGTLELVEAMAQVRQTVPDVQCVIIGDAPQSRPYVQHVKARIAELGLEDCVHLPGKISDDALLDWYRRADLFVLPSMNQGWQFEGYGLVHREASAAGLPVIGTRDCGVEDAIDDGVTGLLVSQERIAQELPQAILKILRDDGLARQMGAAGRAKAQAHTWDDVARQMIALYRAVLGR
ncbi:MAG: glycosyltransferase family 4 protein [Chloroflexi bacterium]|nr:MAG: glycosyltransferase family 4 protein [Chloroflexota bacterium]